MIALVGTLNVTSAIYAIIAASFWFVSAKTENPSTLKAQQFGHTILVPLKPLLKTMGISAEFNKVAALFSALSALSMGAATLLSAACGK